MPPFSKFIYEEGAAIKAFKLVENGVFQASSSAVRKGTHTNCSKRGMLVRIERRTPNNFKVACAELRKAYGPADMFLVSVGVPCTITALPEHSAEFMEESVTFQ